MPSPPTHYVVHSAQFVYYFSKYASMFCETLEVYFRNILRSVRRRAGKMDEHSGNSFIKIRLSEVIIAIGPRLEIPRIIRLSIPRIELS